VLTVHRAPRLWGPLTLDGRAGEAAWGGAPVETTFYRFGAGPAQPARARTRFRAGHTEAGLWLLIRCEREAMETLRVNETERDAADLWRDSSVEVYFGRAADEHGYRKFTFNARGTRGESRERGPGAAWDSEAWEVATSRDEAGWTAECFWAWPALGGRPDVGDTWRFAVTRFPHTAAGHATSAPGAQFDRPGRFGRLVFLGPDADLVETGRALVAARPGPWVAPAGREKAIAATAGGEVRLTTAAEHLAGRRASLRARAKALEAELEAPAPERPVLAHRLRRLGELETEPEHPAGLYRASRSLNMIEADLEHLRKSAREPVAGPEPDPETGGEIYHLRTPYVAGRRPVRVVRPGGVNSETPLRVLYILPVEAEGGTRFGDGLATAVELGLHEKYRLMLVEPDFARSPWYVSHATDPLVRQDAYLERAVVPLIEQRYATVPGRGGRLLLGFSKSGWGAAGLLFREPDFWGRAAAWDAPWMLEKFHWSMAGTFGDRSVLETHHPLRLAEAALGRLGDQPRLIVGGEKLWGGLVEAPPGGSHTKAFHRRLEALGLLHVYRPGLPAPHTWNAAWMEPMVEALVAPSRDGQPAR